MSMFAEKIEACITNGSIDLKDLMEICSVRFKNLSLDDVRFIESECRDLRQKFEEAEKVECFKTRGIQSVGWDDLAYFSIEEIDLVKELTKKQIEKGNFSTEIKKIKISKDILIGHIRDRKEWERK
ncbi:hypothetical protein [Acinetobacter sp. ANC 4558]|uniref:hypothetical protein n=1 Tax=Acinetobacter sp. ANC 4558 TaxID=1977876 RepID=UPI001D17B555|nr:hypothetical protein [Acinetobacter sp. ANC 4558]